MEKTLKELIAEMDRIEEEGPRALQSISREQYIQILAEKFYDALKEVRPSMPDHLARPAADAAARAAASANDLTSVPRPQSSIDNLRSAN